MIVDNRITEYLHSLEKSRGELLDTIEKKAVEEGVPIIRSETAALLRSLTAALRPEKYSGDRYCGWLFCFADVSGDAFKLSYHDH